MNKKVVIIILAVFGILVLTYFLLSKYALTFTSQGRDSTENSQDTDQSQALSIFATHLEVPWGMDFLPDGTMIVTERPGAIKLIDRNGTVTEIAKLDINPDSERGLHGVAVDPNFSENRNVYIHYTYLTEGDIAVNRVARYILENNSLIEDIIILDQIPGELNHNGGRIKFGPDGFLYITTGDAQNSSNAQNLTSTAGKILRITRDGEPAPGNPFNDFVYSYGHRNGQGITWDLDGNLWATEHGRSGDLSGLDELNLIEPGKNYGWPEIQGDETRDGMQTAVINSGPDVTWAPSGAQFLNGSVFFTGLKGAVLYEYKINEDTIVEHLKEKFYRLRNVVIGPDGFLYVATSNRDGRGGPVDDDDKILRIDPLRLDELASLDPSTL